MPKTELRRRLRGSDAMFLYFERKELPLHIGSVTVLDGTFDEKSGEALAARLPEIPRYRQRLVFSPSNLTHPSWEDDPNFNIRNHIRRVRLDPPGSQQQLSELAGAVFTPLMDRTKPLWDITIVDGLEAGRSALIIRIHHCMVDGVAGIGLCNILFDATPQPRQVPSQPFDPPAVPDPQQVLVEGLSSFWADAAERLISGELALLKIAQAFLGDGAKNSLKGLLASAPELLFPADKLPFNRPCSGVRGHCWTRFPFAEAHAIRSVLGGTINDVVLTTTAGAISRYVAAHREPVKGRFARLLVPVNVRTENSQNAGNEISMMPLSVPLGIDDPIELFHAVNARSSAMKAAHIADIVSLIGTWLGWTPPKVQRSFAALPFMPQPVRIVNTVCTNVPGPMVPIYANGREVLEYYPHVPCGGDVGLSVAIASYNRHLHYGVTYDLQAAPDGELFRDFLIETYEELRNRAGVPAAKVAPKLPVRVETPAADVPLPIVEPAAAVSIPVEPPPPEPVPQPQVTVPAAAAPATRVAKPTKVQPTSKARLPVLRPAALKPREHAKAPQAKKRAPRKVAEEIAVS